MFHQISAAYNLPGLMGVEAGGNRAYNAAAMAVLGGTASVIGGGKFANGAVSSAFVQMFNHDNSDSPHKHENNDENEPYRYQKVLDGRVYWTRKLGVCVLPPCGDLLDHDDLQTHMYELAVELDGLKDVRNITGPASLLIKHIGVPDAFINGRIEDLEFKLYGDPIDPPQYIDPLIDRLKK